MALQVRNLEMPGSQTALNSTPAAHPIPLFPKREDCPQGLWRDFWPLSASSPMGEVESPFSCPLSDALQKYIPESQASTSLGLRSLDVTPSLQRRGLRAGAWPSWSHVAALW